MNKYELIVVCDPSLSKKEHDDLIQQIEAEFKENIVEKDDMGMQKLEYKGTKIKNAHIISYYLQADPTEINTKKKAIIYFKGIVKFFIFKMTATQPFFKYADLEKIYQEKFAPLYEQKSLNA